LRRLVVVLGLCIAAAAVFVVVRDLRRGYRSTDGATLEHFTLHSRLVGRDLYEIIVHPALGDKAPRVLLLDGGDQSY
jgi:hypothetical protein